MASKGWVGLLAGISCLLGSTLARAACTMDRDCTDELVCEAGSCVAPAPARAAHPLAAPRPEMRRHSPPMMIVGITMTALGPLALTASASLALDRLNCQASDDPDKKPCRNHSTLIYGSLGLGLALITTGVSLIVLGAKREPVATASVTPWATAEAGGLSLRLQL